MAYYPWGVPVLHGKWGRRRRWFADPGPSSGQPAGWSRDPPGAADQPAARPLRMGPGRWPAPRPGPAVTVAAAAGPVRTAADVLAAFVDAVPDEPGLVLVPHSNAGLYVDALAAVRRVERVVFVDAGLPSRSGPTPVAPAELRRHLEGLADADGLLPPWTGWWPEHAIDAAVPGRPDPCRRGERAATTAARLLRRRRTGAGGATGDDGAPRGAGRLPRVRGHLRRGARDRRAAGMAGRDAGGGAPAPAGRPGGGGCRRHPAGGPPLGRAATAPRWGPDPGEPDISRGGCRSERLGSATIRGSAGCGIDWDVGPTWARFVAPSGCPAQSCEPGSPCCPGMGCLGGSTRSTRSSCASRARRRGGSRANGRRVQQR